MIGIKNYLALTGIILAVFAAVALVVLPAYYGTKYKCASVAKQMEVEHEWGPVKGCFIKEYGRWIPYEQVRSVR